MSYSLSIYSENERIVTVEQLKSQMEIKNWALAFAADLNSETLPDFQGAVKDGLIVYGWPMKDAELAVFHQLRDEGNLKAIMSLARAEFLLMSCELSFIWPYNVENDRDEEELEEIEDFDKKYALALRHAKCAYEIRSGRRGSISFTRDLWRTIGGLVGGLLDDAHDGKHEFVVARK